MRLTIFNTICTRIIASPTTWFRAAGTPIASAILSISASLTAIPAYAGGEHAHQHHPQSTIGKPAPPTQATKTFHVTMDDTMRYTFSPDIAIQPGDIVTFVIHNRGQLNHEFSLGDEAAHTQHRQMMRAMPNMVHTDANTVVVKPGETQRLTWAFSSVAEAIVACNIPGHFEAGMHHALAQ